MKKLSDIQTLFEDQDILIINKPCGIAVQSKDKENDLLAILSTKYGNLHPITRLDQPVSGIVLLAKNSKTAGLLSEALQQHLLVKTYTAVVEGIIKSESDVLQSNIVKKHKAVIITDGEGKNSRLKYKVIKRLDNYTVIEVVPESGRFHQIRVQLSSIGHPVKGDLKYGAKRSNKEGGIYLHASWLMFDHPYTKENIQVVADYYPEKKLYFL